ncbi:hypothetical protein RIF29_16083 [Crotalaria pallida]|uniref:Uncharacterized protein n=1 Tax=Crotalaria pallida TaxID=3830 RepID=A0AAN9FEP3_CROPI
MALVGPPPKSKPQKVTIPTNDPFLDQLITDFRHWDPSSSPQPTPPPMTHTRFDSATFLSSGNPCLDFFFHVVPDTDYDTVHDKLSSAWAHNPLTALKLVCHLRAVRGTGKSDKESFYSAALWLHGLHPKTLACNIPNLAQFGYFKDLPEILYRTLEGADVRMNQRREWERTKGSSNKRYKKMNDPVWRPFGGGRPGAGGSGSGVPLRRGRRGGGRVGKRGGGGGGRKVVRKSAIWSDRNFAEVEKEKAREAREEKKAAAVNKLLKRYRHDPEFRFLHDRVSDYFALCLRKDLEVLRSSGEMKSISLAAKWCPSVDSSFDRSLLLCESIARRIFPREDYPEYEGVEEAHYAYRVRDRLRKEVLVPLRKVLELPEVYIGANRWDLIPYERVASVAMQFYSQKFLNHDKERFAKYLKDVKEGKATISIGALLPHQIIHSLKEGEGGVVAELQWSRMVGDMLSKGRMKNCIAVCDVSENMEGTPMEVSVALGLLVSELSMEPWKGKLITFSENPELHLIQGNDLVSKAKFVVRMKWGKNTNFQRVFDLILDVAVKGKLKPDQMIKKVFVFSGMEFDKASDKPWETDYQAITRKFGEKGYGSAVPEIVFWNLKDSNCTPVPITQEGVTLVSGFSKNLLTMLLDNGGDVSSEDAREAVKPRPEAAMEAAISGPEYQQLVVLD